MNSSPSSPKPNKTLSTSNGISNKDVSANILSLNQLPPLSSLLPESIPISHKETDSQNTKESECDDINSSQNRKILKEEDDEEEEKKKNFLDVFQNNMETIQNPTPNNSFVNEQVSEDSEINKVGQVASIKQLYNY